VNVVWVVEESDDCGVRWRRAELTYRFFHPKVAMLEALEIITDEWRPPEHSLRRLIDALQGESVAYYWNQAIRVVREDRSAHYPAVWQ
jgi:hypothetical protein